MDYYIEILKNPTWIGWLHFMYLGLISGILYILLYKYTPGDKMTVGQAIGLLIISMGLSVLAPLFFLGAVSIWFMAILFIKDMQPMWIREILERKL